MDWTIQDFGAVGEIVGAVAVAVTLIYLTVQIRQTNKGHTGVFFSREYNEADIIERFAAIGEGAMSFQNRFRFDNSDHISASHIIRQLASVPRSTVIVVDYLQLLDQRRENPELADQVTALKSFAQKRGLIIVFISQIDRSFDASGRACPQLEDVRLPNPLELMLFNKACFLHDGELNISSVV